jgi:hypothetical protein
MKIVSLNLPVTLFAKLAGKSRDQVNRELQAGKLPALRMGVLSVDACLLRHSGVSRMCGDSPATQGWCQSTGLM